MKKFKTRSTITYFESETDRMFFCLPDVPFQFRDKFKDYSYSM